MRNSPARQSVILLDEDRTLETVERSDLRVKVGPVRVAVTWIWLKSRGE